MALLARFVLKAEHAATVGKNFCRQHFEIFYLFFPENRIFQFMHIVFLGDNFYEMSNPVSWEK